MHLICKTSDLKPDIVELHTIQSGEKKHFYRYYDSARKGVRIREQMSTHLACTYYCIK